MSTNWLPSREVAASRRLLRSAGRLTQYHCVYHTVLGTTSNYASAAESRYVQIQGGAISASPHRWPWTNESTKLQWKQWKAA